MTHLKQATRSKISEQLGGADFVLVSMQDFEWDGEKRTRYTVRRPKGQKLYHLIGFANGSIVLC